MDHPELDFFNTLRGKLDIELTVPAEPVAGLLNLRAEPSAGVAKLILRAEVYEPDADEKFRELTPEELDSVAFRGSSITLRGESGGVVAHDSPNGAFFTVRELLRAVEETERQTRDQSEWLGGVDVHHCFLEGIHPGDDDDVWEIHWGS